MSGNRYDPYEDAGPEPGPPGEDETIRGTDEGEHLEDHTDVAEVVGTTDLPCGIGETEPPCGGLEEGQEDASGAASDVDQGF